MALLLVKEIYIVCMFYLHDCILHFITFCMITWLLLFACSTVANISVCNVGGGFLTI